MPVVLGLGFGDEGKGRVVDWLTSQKDDRGISKYNLVARFSGGHQAGHKVIRGENEHVCSSFGAGIFNGLGTLISSNCTFYPSGFLNEAKLLNTKGISVSPVYLDRRAMITTIFDVQYQQNDSTNIQNGTVGVGFGSTVLRSEKVTFTLDDICNFNGFINSKVLYEKLLAIARYYYSKGLSVSSGLVKEQVDDIIYIINDAIKQQILIPVYQEDLVARLSHIVYEGSQGILLDKDHGFFPHVTRGKTDMSRIPEINPNFSEQREEVYLVTRAYCTRHGNGPMPIPPRPSPVPVTLPSYETNQSNHYQGDFRLGVLDLDLLAYAARKAVKNRTKGVNLVVTCVDQLESFELTYGGYLNGYSELSEFLFEIKSAIPAENYYYSNRPEGELIPF